MQRTITSALALIALGATAGCGGDENPASMKPAARPPVATTGETQADAKTITIKMKRIAFTPPRVTVRVGQTVRWVNAEDVDHNVDSKAFHSKTFRLGGSFEYTTEKPGTIAYICTVHPFMKGKLVVTRG